MEYGIFDFERQVDPSGAQIPLAVRMKLDLAGLKLSLSAWQRLTNSQRERLCKLHGETNEAIDRFGESLRVALADAGCDAPAPLGSGRADQIAVWRDPGEIPEAVSGMCRQLGLSVNWNGLGRFGRYVLWHLAARNNSAGFRSAERALRGTQPL